MMCFIRRLLILTVFCVWACPAMAVSSSETLVYDVHAHMQGQSSIRIIIHSNQELSHHFFTLSAGKPRFVMDTQRLRYQQGAGFTSEGKRVFSDKSFIYQMRFAPRGQDKTRLVFDLRGAASPGRSFLRISPFSGTHFLTLDLNVQGALQVSGRAGGPQDDIRPEKRAQSSQRKTKPIKKPVIVLDAGHGGHDPGTIGARGTREKHVTLKAALNLKASLEKQGRYTVFLTRKNDKYLSLNQRVSFARKKGADLFISLHADSAPSKSLRGASVYTLSDRGERRASEVLQKQNWVMEVDLSDHSGDVSGILVDLAQRDTKTESAVFSDLLISRLRKATPVLRKTHRRAGYYVLLAPDVPAILLEMGFLSNTTDEANLKSSRHRSKITRAIAEAIDSYFATKDKRERGS